MDFVTLLSYTFGDGEETAQRLRSAGYTAPERIQGVTPEKLSRITGLSASCSRSILKFAEEAIRQGKGGTQDRLEEIKEIGKGRAAKLRKAGLSTVEGVADAGEERIAYLLKVPKSTARKIVRSAQTMVRSLPTGTVSARKAEILMAKGSAEARRPKEVSKESQGFVNSFWRFG